MLLLLPPSETKRPGGDPGTVLDLEALSFPQLTPARRAALAGVRRLSSNLRTAAVALGLGPRSTAEAALNRELRTSPTMPVIDRFDGVLYDALDAGSLPDDARRFAAEHVAVHSALFGPVGALDPVPAYRLSAGTPLPGGPSLRAIWRDRAAAALAARPGLLLDLRSEAYAALGPLPPRRDAVFLRVVTAGDDGPRRALNHFNKHAKGEFTRRILLAGVTLPDVAALLDWAAADGIRLEPGAPGELDLVVDEPTAR